MLDPVVVSLPLGLALIAILAAAALAYRHWLEDTPNSWARLTAPTPATGGRHRLDRHAGPYRDWAAIAAERISETRQRRYAADYRQPLTDFERRVGVIAWHDDRPTEARPSGLFGIPWDTNELAVIR